MVYATLDQLHPYLEQLDLDAVQADVLAACLDRASDQVRLAIAGAVGDPAFTYGAYGVASSRLLTATGGTLLTLPPHQAGTVTAIRQLITTAPPTYTVIDSASWLVVGRSVVRSAGWWSGYVQIDAVWGYGPPPPAAVQITLELAVNIWRARDKGGWTEQIGVEGAGSMRFVSGLTRQQQDTIQQLARQHWQVSL